MHSHPYLVLLQRQKSVNVNVFITHLSHPTKEISMGGYSWFIIFVSGVLALRFLVVLLRTF